MTEVACMDCGKLKSEERRQSLTRGRCRACYQRHVYALKKAGTFEAINPVPVQERLFSKGVAGRNGCIIWTGVINPRNGYGQISPGTNTLEYTHRVAYRLMKGEIPEGLVIDHACHNRDAECPGGNCIHHRCINPHHLEAVTHRENRIRSPLTKAGRVARKTHCKQGHEFTPENTYLRGDGSRKCRVCHRQRQQQWNAKRRTTARKLA
ncbi:HNH endonuclease signature motif containing protein [Streptomyces pseudogriseolus]|uniref:HNH endonuclease signature motif containing protein n=1 Tax=Streptomyces pseudogriseolus TaxID=36817 RepID=UPI00366697A1